MKQTIITGLIILVIAGLLSVIVWGSKGKQVSSVEPQSDQTSANASPTTTVSDAPIFFYGNTCPHCKDVEEWMAINKIEEKIEIVKKEVYDNRANSLELTQAAKSCGLPTDSIGVPFLFTEGQCLIGTPDITSYLSEKAGITDATEATERSQQ